MVQVANYCELIPLTPLILRDLCRYRSSSTRQTSTFGSYSTLQRGVVGVHVLYCIGICTKVTSTVGSYGRYLSVS